MPKINKIEDFGDNDGPTGCVISDNVPQLLIFRPHCHDRTLLLSLSCHGDRSLGNAILFTISRFKTSTVAIPLSGKV